MIEWVKSLLANPRKALASALRTAVAVAAVLALASQYVNIPSDVIAWVAAAVTALRTLVAMVDKSNTEFGAGA
jgi:hypothetical protein